MDGTKNLTGVWHGLYSYPDGRGPVFFVATLLQSGSLFSGTTHEAIEGFLGAPLRLFASVEGSIAGIGISFRKTYDGSIGWRHGVDYAGTLSQEPAEIEGQWTIPNQLSGRFLMIRGTAADERVIRQAFEKV